MAASRVVERVDGLGQRRDRAGRRSADTIAGFAGVARGRSSARSAVAPRGDARSAARPARLECRRRATARRARRCRRCRARSTTPWAARMPSAIGRSNDEPALRTSAGARLTVMRCGGKSKPELRIALRDAVAALAHARIGQADHRERRQAERDVDFDVDRRGLDAEDRGRPQAGQHALDPAKLVAPRSSVRVLVLSGRSRSHVRTIWRRSPRGQAQIFNRES